MQINNDDARYILLDYSVIVIVSITSFRIHRGELAVFSGLLMAGLKHGRCRLTARWLIKSMR